MCGFSGEIDLTRVAADAAAVAQMAETMADRGPDGAGLWAQGGVALGHRRLKIIDLSERAQQPMVDAELGLAIAFNGCIYNQHELRRELEGAGYRFFSTGDTEVILKAYHHWGDGFVDHLTGMFAFAVVERDSGRVVLGRDRLGIKPLYLAEVGSSLRFASTLPALLAGGGVDTSIDPVALHQYLTFHSVVPAPRTILQGVRKLPPATLLCIEPDGRRQQTTYWRTEFGRRPEHEGWSARDWEDAILASLRTAVDRRMVADVAVGCLLSGGLDSSLVVGLLAEAGVRDLLTFSIGFESHGGLQGDGVPYSDLLARALRHDHHRLRIPTPFAVGRVNCYLLEDEPLTLIDTGANSGKGLDELEHQLAEHGRSIEELELLILTHQHIDHIGLAEIIASRSGAEVAAIGAPRPAELPRRFTAAIATGRSDGRRCRRARPR